MSNPHRCQQFLYGSSDILFLRPLDSGVSEVCQSGKVKDVHVSITFS